ncbi:hypothetical protein GE21DRAFT_5544 [Neurospora crassa]|uniref:Rhodopsin domain-containing protein n=1 Tax=Neurospora crassa (strain ATCC 24698 / 74-OR23-1A / CBS 708.71 / DSM 1257 / FGSC 987) TaxID=367110 RepID=Q7S896_NEUCR|nr:hypothetical protein NCU06531 [Neurospora crassa OR74A]EAA32567.1 hypothetical protein NCU06531 [Neurospora crassa OR74A]KHE79105.1 hypothetical protein GE21DRAFT_5544 [Neurospora crassa]|eukprot:XP_961803.1 hypothetical protein NCU06531 [Neurospora crassa OR74A]
MRRSLSLWDLFIAVLLFLFLLSPPVRAYNTSKTVISEILEGYPSCADECITPLLTLLPCSYNNDNNTSSPTPSELLTCLCSPDPHHRPSLTSCLTTSCRPIPLLTALNQTATLCHDTPRNRSSQLVILTLVLGTLSPLLVLLRLFFRLLTHHPSSGGGGGRHRLGLDDWVIFLSIPLGIPYTVLIAHSLARAGIGRDVWTLTPQEATWFLKVFYVLIEYYVAIMAYVKMPFLFMYLRIFGDESKRTRRVLWGTVGTVVLVGGVFLLPVGCKPSVKVFWEGWDGEHEGRCDNINASAWTLSIVTIVLDLWIMAIPLSQLRKLNMDWKKKLAVGLMLCVGVFDTMISIIRLHSLLAFQPSTNVTWDYYPVAVWSAVEYHVAVICACLPAMRQLLVRVFPILESNIGKSNGSHGVGVGAGAGDYVSNGAERNVLRPETHQYQWQGQSRGVTSRNKGPWTRARATETESERDIVLGSFRSSARSTNVEVLEVDDVKRQSAGVRILAASSLDSAEKRNGFGLSFEDRTMERDGRADPEVFPSSRR